MTHPDIVQRLLAWRNANNFDYTKDEFLQYPLAIEAATEITTLRQQLAEAREANKSLVDALEDARGNLEFSKNAITHPNGRRAHHIDSADQIKIDVLDEAITAIDASLTPGGNHG